MKNIVIWLCSVLMVVSLSACTNPGESNRTETAGINERYVGEWKAKVVSSLMDGVTTYKTATIELNKDGSGTYQGRALRWEYSEEYHTIAFTIIKDNLSSAFEIQEEGGIPVLTYYGDRYYRTTALGEGL